MIRLTSKLTTFRKVGVRWFSEIQQHKPTPIQLKAQKQGIMFKKQLDYKYKLINSSPNDSIDLIQTNFMTLKSKLNSRHFYMPHKKQYLLMLDQAYEDIMKIHEDYNIVQLSKPKGSVSKRQQVTYQLEKIKFAKKIALYQTYQFAAVLLIFIIAIQILFEQFELEGKQKMNATTNFSFIQLLNSIYVSFIDKLKKFSKLDLLDQIKTPEEIKKLFEDMVKKKKVKIQQINNK